MRYPDLSRSVTLPGGQKYTLGNLLSEFCWGAGFWSVDDATVAAFDRAIKAVKANPEHPEFDNTEFDRIANHLRNLNFPPHVAIELTELRNAFVLAPSEQKAPPGPPEPARPPKHRPVA